MSHSRNWHDFNALTWKAGGVLPCLSLSVSFSIFLDEIAKFGNRAFRVLTRLTGFTDGIVHQAPASSEDGYDVRIENFALFVWMRCLYIPSMTAGNIPSR